MKNRLLSIVYFFPFFLMLITVRVFPEPVDIKTIGQLVQSMKKDERGPFQSIRWFCTDGSVLPANQRCPQPGGVQHGLHKDVVQTIAQENHIFIGQILAGTLFPDFVDTSNNNSRMKQYQIERYLQRIDDGWVFRLAQYYRGAFQAEDEETWGANFLNWLLANDEKLQSQFFLIRQLSKDIPHKSNDNRLNTIRAVTKTLADSLPSFMELRIKIHGQPEASDVERVKSFHAANRQRVSQSVEKMFQNLEQEMELVYRKPDNNSLKRYLSLLPETSPLAGQLKKVLDQTSTLSNTEGSRTALPGLSKEMASLLWSIRTNLTDLKSPATRLAMLDLSHEIETILFITINEWKPQTLGELLEKNYTLAQATAGCGYLECREWELVEPFLLIQQGTEHISLTDFQGKEIYFRRVVEWGAAMVGVVYGAAVSGYTGIEPLAAGYIDDSIRSSLLLPLGSAAEQCAEIAARYRGATNDVMGIGEQHQIRGINPGFVFGELVVVTGSPDTVSFQSNNIYVFSHAPATLKPVGGIAAVSEGNLVSHVQLLARNFGIPNAVLSQNNLLEIAHYSGQRVFYAVSPQGTVIMKPAASMNTEEKNLVADRKRSNEKILVPTQKIDLKETDLIDLTHLKASDSGRICGPKAANLGELKSLFPDNVVNGFIIPFGVFQRHLDQIMPGTGVTYWRFLQDTFSQLATEKTTGKPEEETDPVILERLTQLREAIKHMTFLPGFKENIERRFLEVFFAPMGKVPVFIRSDTNMEDLKEFTGAGLNLTVFNIVDSEKILQGIRDVWASPYTERSYRWRQHYISNPENVYPSILILPTVDVNKSGVMITTGVSTSDTADITLAFNRGAGGAVEGQAAESYVLKNNGRIMILSPSRTPDYTILPKTGGTQKRYSFFNKPVLEKKELDQLREFAQKIKEKLKDIEGIGQSGPYDVELGFKDDDIWLFQVRPYVENMRSKSSMYLLSLDPKVPGNVTIDLKETIINN